MPDLSALRVEIKGYSTPQLREEFRKGLQLSVEQLTRLALVLQELEARGEKVSGTPWGLLPLLRDIARGDLLPEVVVQFAASPKVIRQVGKLSPQEQQTILDDPARCAEKMRPKRSQRDRPRATHSHAVPHEDEVKRNPLLLARTANAKDVANLIAEMIAANPEPALVWAALLKEPIVRQLSRD